MAASWGGYFAPRLTVAERKKKAEKQIAKMIKEGKTVQPVRIEGRKIAQSFWGKGWCDHLESFADYAYRLDRGRSYVRSNSVCHLDIRPGHIHALVCGSSLYKLNVKIKPLTPEAWKIIKNKCAGGIGSMLELLQGKLSDHVMKVVSDRKHGLFPQPDEIGLDCSCPDYALMCKHVAAALYGVGARLDHQPEMLFLLRGVDPAELIDTKLALPSGVESETGTLDSNDLGALFGIDLESPTSPVILPTPEKSALPAARKRKTSKAAASGKSTTRAIVSKPTKKTKTKTRTSSTAKAKPAAKKAPSPKSQKTRTPIAWNPNRPRGSAITAMRKRAGLSLPEFAKALGVTQTTVLRWVRSKGTLNLRSDSLEALTRFDKRHPD